jgi:hypothetical protein
MAASDSEDLWTRTEYRTSEGEVRVLAPVLLCSTEVHLCTIPSFAVVQVQLRRIKYQLNKSLSGAVITLDGLIKDDPSLDRLSPAELSFAVPVGLNCTACYVKVSPSIQPTLI